MRFRTVLAASAAILLPGLAAAQPITGLYVGAGALWNFKQDEHLQTSPGANTGKSTLRFDAGGYGGLGSVGWGFGNGLRVEVEGDYRESPLRGRGNSINPALVGSSTQQDYGVMGNVLYDLDFRSYGINLPVDPYVGVGAGYQWSHLNGFNSQNLVNGNVTHFGGTSSGFAYQGIVGAAYKIDAVPGLALTAEYRFLGVLGNEKFTGHTYRATGATLVGNENITENLNHSVILGIRYAFNQPAPPAPTPVSQPVPVQQPSRTFLVFFDWDRADLTDRARQIVANAAEASRSTQTTNIDVQGNADLSGTHQYNQRLSLRRAQTVAAELVRDGVPSNIITIQAFGDTRPLVPTAPGVREPQNRRVAIILR